MFEIGTLVIYGSEGVCKILDVELKAFFNSNELKEYYVLEPQDNKQSKLFVPVDGENVHKKMQPMLSYEEIVELINDDTEIEWIVDNKQRSKYYTEVFKKYDRRMIIALARCLYGIKNGKLLNIKRLFSIDEEMLKKITQALFIEFSYVMKIEQEQVLPFINKEIMIDKK